MPRRASYLLERDRLVAEALRIIDEQGFDALTMRKLAAALGVDPMAAYYHVPGGKTALIRLVIEHVFSALVVAAPEGAWQDRVRRWADAYKAVAVAHPNLVLQIVSDLDAIGSAAVRANEALYTALEAAGLAADDVVRGAGLVVDFIHGFMLGEVASTAPGSGDFMSRELLQQPDAAFPVQRRILTVASPWDSHTYFSFGLETIIAGLAGRIA